MAELWARGAGALAAAIAAGEVSSREVIEAHLARIEAVNPVVNAVTVVLADSALEAADAADRAVAAGQALGPLHGVPFTVKENIDLAGTATTNGLVALADAIAPLDAPQVSRLRAAGGIPIGRTNLPDLGLRVHTDNELRGLTRNPWHPGRTASGSSGGEAVAHATGMSPLGLGNDIGGSLRNPAYCCGTTALKPTVGRIGHAGSVPPTEPMLAEQLMAVQGPMARHVADVRPAFSLLAGRDPRAPLSVPAPLDGPPVPSPIRVAVCTDPAGGGVHPSVAEGVRRAADVLTDAGYDVVEAEPPSIAEAVEVWQRILASDLDHLRPLVWDLMSADSRRFLELNEERTPVPTGEQVFFDHYARVRIAQEWQRFSLEHPVTVGPVWSTPPFEVGYDIAGADEAADVIQRLRLVVAINLVGVPAAVVPVGVADGLPQGVQIVADRFREDLCLDVAATLEDALGVITPVDPVTA
ncbi:MAG TPA: amidase [Acidimicrobiales bacterium]|nr:amidase [Acidimicrobiales bacterium]